MGGGDHCTTMVMYLVPLNCTLKSVTMVDSTFKMMYRDRGVSYCCGGNHFPRCIICQIDELYTLNFHSVACQLYFNNAGEKMKNKIIFKRNSKIINGCSFKLLNI